MRDLYGAFGARRVGDVVVVSERIEVMPFQKIKNVVKRESVLGNA